MGKQAGCYADSIAANPNLPTVANPADITQYGVLELEYEFYGQTKLNVTGVRFYAVGTDIHSCSTAGD
jgi:hypothetical protein